MSELRKPGTYEFLEFKVSPFGKSQPFIDIKGLIHEWELFESMDSGNLHGSAIVIDSIGLLDDFVQENPHPWIKGEEQIIVKYSDFYANREPLTHKLFLYAVTDVKNISTSQNTSRQYKIHFTSIDKFLTERFSVRKGFIDGTINEYVKSVFDAFYKESQHYSKKQIEIADTEGKQNFVIPNYSPEQTLHFLARKAYGPAVSSTSPDLAQTWRFFENREKYYFTTHSELAGFNADDVVKYIKIDNADKTPEGNLLIQQSILNIDYPVHINTFEDMLEGGYYSSTTELDYINRSPSFVEYRYLDDYDEYAIWPGNEVRSKHSKKFVDQYMNTVRDVLVIKDYGSPNDPGGKNFVRPETYYPQMYNQKRVNQYHHMNQSFQLKVYGNNKVMAGSIIELDLEKVDSQNSKKKDILRSGRYIVESVRNLFSEEMYYQIMTVSNSGIFGQKEKDIEYERGRQALSSYTEEFDVYRSGKNSDGTKKKPGDENYSSQDADSINAASGDISAREKEAMDYYISKGYTPEQAAGIVGNLVNESGLRVDARNKNDGGPGKDSVGIAQWNRERLAGLDRYASERGTSRYDFTTQLGYVDYELRNNESRAGSMIRNSSSAADAAIGMTTFERFKGYRGGTNNSEVRSRISQSKRLLGNYQDTQRPDS